jgi:hypothetical protein
MLKLTYEITGDRERIARVMKTLNGISDPFRSPLELPELKGRWVAARVGFCGGGFDRGGNDEPSRLVIELEEYLEA